MTPLLTYVLLAVALTFVQVVVAALLCIGDKGLPEMAGNREGFSEPPSMAGRAVRAHRNMLENLVLFVALALVAHVANRANAQVLLGAQIFFWARVVYAVVYVIGIPWVRTGVWAISIVGLIMMALPLL